MAGDLSGYSRWRIAPTSAGARAVFEEDVVAEKPLLRRFAFPSRVPANHTLMMRHGQHGLRTYLAGYRARIRLGSRLSAFGWLSGTRIKGWSLEEFLVDCLQREVVVAWGSGFWPSLTRAFVEPQRRRL